MGLCRLCVEQVQRKEIFRDEHCKRIWIQEQLSGDIVYGDGWFECVGGCWFLDEEV